MMPACYPVISDRVMLHRYFGAKLSKTEPDTCGSTSSPLQLVVSKLERMSYYDEDGMRRDAKLCGAASATGRNTSRDHQQAQRIVCIVCFRKGKSFQNLTDGKKDKEGNYVPGIKDHIKEFVLSDLDTHWSWLPVVICDMCRKNLKTWKKHKENGERWATWLEKYFQYSYYLF